MKIVEETCPTGQTVTTEYGPHGFETSRTTACAECGATLTMRGSAWFDPYRGKNGKYVCKHCLSPKRASEVAKIEEIHRKQGAVNQIIHAMSEERDVYYSVMAEWEQKNGSFAQRVAENFLRRILAVDDVINDLNGRMKELEVEAQVVGF